MPSFVLFSVLLLVLTMLTEKFFFVIFGPIDVVLRSDELYFVFDSVDLFSATGTLLRLIIFIYNCSYLQYYYIQNSTLGLKSLLTKIIKRNLKFNKNNVSQAFLKVLYVLDPTVPDLSRFNFLTSPIAFNFAIGYFNLSYYFFSTVTPFLILFQDFQSLSLLFFVLPRAFSLLSPDYSVLPQYFFQCPKTSVPRPLFQD